MATPCGQIYPVGDLKWLPQLINGCVCHSAHVPSLRWFLYPHNEPWTVLHSLFRKAAPEPQRKASFFVLGLSSVPCTDLIDCKHRSLQSVSYPFRSGEGLVLARRPALRRRETLNGDFATPWGSWLSLLPPNSLLIVYATGRDAGLHTHSPTCQLYDNEPNHNHYSTVMTFKGDFIYQDGKSNLSRCQLVTECLRRHYRRRNSVFASYCKSV